jgi:hypothetical protein
MNAQKIQAQTIRILAQCSPLYNAAMRTLAGSTLEHLLDPIARILTPDVARKLVKVRFDPAIQAKIDRLAQKCNEGELNEPARREYESYVHAIDFIAVLQRKARALLKRSENGR